MAMSSVNNAIARLVEAGIVRDTTRGKRNRAFVAPDVVEKLELVERRTASRKAPILQKKAPERIREPFLEKVVSLTTSDSSQPLLQPQRG